MATPNVKPADIATNSGFANGLMIDEKKKAANFDTNYASRLASSRPLVVDLFPLKEECKGFNSFIPSRVSQKSDMDWQDVTHKRKQRGTKNCHIWHKI